MNIHILTHDQVIYATAILVLLTIGSASLAQKVDDIFGVHRRLSIVSVHLAILALLALVAICSHRISGILPHSGRNFILLCIAGIMLGSVAVRADRFVLQITLGTGNFLAPRSLSWSALLMSATVAFLEELMFRGYLVQLCLSIPFLLLSGMALLFSALLFAITHIYYGYEQVLAKLPLSILALLSVLTTHTLLAAIVAHVVFNLRSTDASILSSTRNPQLS
ncbi:CPBP family intramembrane glutamic endopeptidase [Tunturiibacter gelidoferens]|uniref:Uncharacterized protein n=1 Tax=Tunturiibacter gelidiferens TaxID=3069689 RepID=A0ACC5P5L1_9BACT|nr:CPBP family intramembrane glutamic endopeptidase [Edaphobacter lichenicola]MBB5342005.1 hypothetical protein [Edaphobacter lichenicola]